MMPPLYTKQKQSQAFNVTKQPYLPPLLSPLLYPPLNRLQKPAIGVYLYMPRPQKKPAANAAGFWFFPTLYMISVQLIAHSNFVDNYLVFVIKYITSELVVHPYAVEQII